MSGGDADGGGGVVALGSRMVSTDCCGSDGRTNTDGEAAGSGATAPVAAQDKKRVF